MDEFSSEYLSKMMEKAVECLDRIASAAERGAMTEPEKNDINMQCANAIRDGRFRDAKALINSGANVHHRVYISDRTLFSLACQTGNRDMLEFLLERNATIGDLDNDRKTSMDYARAACDKDTLNMLEAWNGLSNTLKRKRS